VLRQACRKADAAYAEALCQAGRSERMAEAASSSPDVGPHVV